jgi:hypothetical protein
MNRRARTPADPRPLLRDRISAAPNYVVEVPDAGAPAITLIANPEETDRRLIAHVFPAKPSAALRPIAWTDAGRLVYLPLWQKFARENASLLAGMTPQSLPEVVHNLAALSDRVPNPPGMLLGPPQRIKRLRAVIQSAVCLLLMDRGWEVCAQAGQFVFTRDGVSIRPVEEIVALESGKEPAETWRERWRATGLADVPLDCLSHAGD